MLLSSLYNINSVIDFKSLCIAFMLHCDLRLYDFGRFLVFFLYTLSYEVFILFFIEFIIVIRFVSRDQEVVVAFHIYIYIYRRQSLSEIIKWNRNYDGQWKKKEG